METIIVIVSNVVVVPLHEGTLVIKAVVVLNVVLVSNVLLIGISEVHQPRTDGLETVVVIFLEVMVVALDEGALVVEAVVVLNVVLVGNSLRVGVLKVHQDDWLLTQVVQVDQLEGLVSTLGVRKSLQVVHVPIDLVSLEVVGSLFVVVVSLVVLKINAVVVIQVVCVILVCVLNGSSRSVAHFSVDFKLII